MRGFKSSWNPCDEHRDAQSTRCPDGARAGAASSLLQKRSERPERRTWRAGPVSGSRSTISADGPARLKMHHNCRASCFHRAFPSAHYPGRGQGYSRARAQSRLAVRSVSTGAQAEAQPQRGLAWRLFLADSGLPASPGSAIGRPVAACRSAVQARPERPLDAIERAGEARAHRDAVGDFHGDIDRAAQGGDVRIAACRP